VLDSNGFDVRSDYSASAKLTIFGRYSLQKFTRSGPGLFGPSGWQFLPSDLGGFAGTSNVRMTVSRWLQLHVQSDFLTDFRFGYLRYHVQYHRAAWVPHPPQTRESQG